MLLSSKKPTDPSLLGHRTNPLLHNPINATYFAEQLTDTKCSLQLIKMH